MLGTASRSTKVALLAVLLAIVIQQVPAPCITAPSATLCDGAGGNQGTKCCTPLTNSSLVYCKGSTGATANGTCSICKTCTTGFYASANCTQYADTTCTACTASCPTDQYLSGTCTSTANTVCRNCSTCGGGTYKTADCTSTANTVCTNCTNNPNNCATFANPGVNCTCATCKAGFYYKSEAEGCVACTTCTAGSTYETTACTTATNRVCSTCGSCTLQETYRTSACTTTSNIVCTACGTCTSGTQYKTTNCTLTANTGCATCTACTAGYYRASGCDGIVNSNCILCPNYVNSIGTTAYPVAGNCTISSSGCKAGYWYKSEAEGCVECTPACSTTGYYESSSCTTQTDRVCATCTDCGAGTVPDANAAGCDGVVNTACSDCPNKGNADSYEEAGVTCDVTACKEGFTYGGLERGCEACTPACTSGEEYESTACTTATDRVCATCDTCVPGQKVTKCDGVSDTECVDCPGKDNAETYQAPGETCAVEACKSEFYDDGENGCTTCTSACTSGTEYESTACTTGSDRECSGCTPCLDGEKPTGGCDGLIDTVCTACPNADNVDTYEESGKSCVVTACKEGYWYKSIEDGCVACDACVFGQKTLGGCDGIDNYQCEDCPNKDNAESYFDPGLNCEVDTCKPGHWYKTLEDGCVACKSCGRHEYISVPCTQVNDEDSADNVCETCEFCSKCNGPNIEDCATTVFSVCTSDTDCESANKPCDKCQIPEGESAGICVGDLAKYGQSCSIEEPSFRCIMDPEDEITSGECSAPICAEECNECSTCQWVDSDLSLDLVAMNAQCVVTPDKVCDGGQGFCTSAGNCKHPRTCGARKTVTNKLGTLCSHMCAFDTDAEGEMMIKQHFCKYVSKKGQTLSNGVEALGTPKCGNDALCKKGGCNCKKYKTSTGKRLLSFLTGFAAPAGDW